MSVRLSDCLCSVNSVKTLRLQDCWADVDDTWQYLAKAGGVNRHIA